MKTSALTPCRQGELWPCFGFSLCLFLLLFGPSRGAAGQVSLSVTPAYVYLAEEAPHGSFTLRNEGTERVEVLITARYGVIESDAAGTSTHVTLEEGGAMGDLTPHLTFFPDRAIVEPGREQVVRFMVRGAEALPGGAHLALMHYQMQERHSLAEDQVPAVATGLSIVYNLVAPLVLIKGEGAARLDAEVLSTQGGALTLLVANRSVFPFVGGITASLVRGEEEIALGRAETAVYTRRRVEVPLGERFGAILEEGRAGDRLLLRFDAAYGQGLAPETRRRLRTPEPLVIDL